ncbi:hypothetical protein [uncultured Granulicatella sp.]|uniref:hypothetical protein n=1 Tax=uncultured Granulicatella sp. TaxID=316089 RepID=UPI002633D0C4|nr:hypothetical protein [uncultured Granulicatella sp.]
MITILGLSLIACTHRPEQTTNNSEPGVQISNNQSSTTQAKSENKVDNTTKAPSNTESPKVETTTVEKKNGNEIAKQTIAEIEKRKRVVLNQNYDIIIQAQTSDTIDLQIRHGKRSSTSIFDFFRYHSKDHKLEEMDIITGEYKVVE